MNYEQEARLVGEARKGSNEAFSEILCLHQAQVRAYLSRYVRVDDVVDDLAQETFLNAYRSLGSYRAESSLRTWLLSIARHMALRYLEDTRRRRAHPPGGVESQLASSLLSRIEGDPTLEAKHEREMSALDECLKQLPAKSGGLVAEFYYKGRRAAEIARAAGKKESAVWMSLLRIRQALRECVQARLEGKGAL